MMAEVSSGLTLDQVNQLIATSALSLPSFVNGGSPMAVADLLTNFPASAPYLYKYARVTDLYGQANSVMVCEASGGSYYWRPQRADYAANNAATGGAVTLTPLVTAPILYLTGALSLAMTITPSVANAWPGATFTVVSKGALNLLSININGLIGGGTLPIAQGATRTLSYIQGQGWQAG